MGIEWSEQAVASCGQAVRRSAKDNPTRRKVCRDAKRLLTEGVEKLVEGISSAAKRRETERAETREEFELERVVSCGLGDHRWRTKLRLGGREPFDDLHWAILQTPHRFRTKRQLWTYSGFGIETQSSADHRSVNGQLERAKKQSSIRGLNRNCNHDLKNLFKGAAIVASSKPGPFQEFYTALLTKGLRPEMARLTLARKIATIVLIVWKRGACFDAQHLKPQTA